MSPSCSTTPPHPTPLTSSTSYTRSLTLPPRRSKPLNAADLEYAKAIVTFDDEVFMLALLPDVRECDDPAAYRREALAGLAKAPAQIEDLHREAGSLAGQDRFLVMRDSEHAAVAARRLLRVQAHAGEEEAARALAAVHRVMAGKGAAHDLLQAAAGWRESADEGDASAQFLIGALLARGGGGIKRSQPAGKRYLELSAAAGNEAAVTLLKELRKCVGCGELDVHHMICSQCRNARYCDDDCQRRHWQCLMDPHKPHCVPRRESAGAGGPGGSSDLTAPVPAPDPRATTPLDPVSAAEAVRAVGNDMFRAQKYPEVRPGVKHSGLWYRVDSPMCSVTVSDKMPVLRWLTPSGSSLWFNDASAVRLSGIVSRAVILLSCTSRGPTPRRSSSTPSASGSTPTMPR